MGSNIEVGVLYVSRRVLYLYLVSGLIMVVMMPLFSIAQRWSQKI